MKKWIKQIISILVTATLVVGVALISPAVFGEASLQERLEQATREKQKALEARQKAQGELSGVMGEITKLDNEAEIINAQLTEMDLIIEETNEKIVQKEAEIAEFERQIEEMDEAFRSRLRAMDETNAVDYIELLLDAKNISDFVNRIETIREITAYDQGVISEMERLKKGVEEAHKELLNTKSEQEQVRAEIATKKAELDQKIAAKEQYMAELKKDVAKYQQMEEAAAAQEEALKRSIAASSSKGTAGASGRIEYNGGTFCWPAPSYTYISSPYGYRIHPVYGTQKFHSGLDLAAPGGSPILAAADGVVKFAGWNGGYGNCLIIDHGSGIQTLYGHSSKLLVSAGQTVSRGQTVALVGTTGTSTGNHLHFEVLNNGSTTDPMPYLQ